MLVRGQTIDNSDLCTSMVHYTMKLPKNILENISQNSWTFFVSLQWILISPSILRLFLKIYLFLILYCEGWPKFYFLEIHVKTLFFWPRSVFNYGNDIHSSIIISCFG